MVLHIPYRIHTKVLTKRNIWSISKRPKGTLQDKGVEIVEGHLMPDHVHLLLEIPLKLSVSSFMGYLKGKSALMMLDRHANLKYKFGKNFWPKGFYVSTVGLNIATVEKYIREQEMHDLMVDKLSVKEYGNPFSNATKRRRREKGKIRDKKTK